MDVTVASLVLESLLMELIRKKVEFNSFEEHIFNQIDLFFLLGAAKCTTGAIRRVLVKIWNTTSRILSLSSGNVTVDPLIAVRKNILLKSTKF